MTRDEDRVTKTRDEDEGRAMDNAAVAEVAGDRSVGLQRVWC